MKTLYIATLLFAGITTLYAQENKSTEQQDQIQAIKNAKLFETKMMQKSNNKKTETKNYQLASEQGLEIKKYQSTSKPDKNNGKLLANIATLDEILASNPNRNSSKITTTK